MKNVTLSADDDLIERARLIARFRGTTLNTAFRQWLVQYTGQASSGREFDVLMQQLKHVKTGRKFSRDEMNER